MPVPRSNFGGPQKSMLNDNNKEQSKSNLQQACLSLAQLSHSLFVLFNILAFDMGTMKPPFVLKLPNQPTQIPNHNKVIIVGPLVCAVLCNAKSNTELLQTLEKYCLFNAVLLLHILTDKYYNLDLAILDII